MGIKPLGKFGEHVRQYEKARRPYPSEVFRSLKSQIKVKKPFILDLGCGTGISSRQLAKYGRVIGCDPDPTMIRHAKKHKRPLIRYVLSSAHKLPFPAKTFDVVTAFSAFHWFDDRKSLEEIKRVLKPEGLFFIASRTGSRNWGDGYRNAIIRSIKRQVAQFAKTPSYNPKKTLKTSGFKKVQSFSWKKFELYTFNNALEYVQSVSIWNSVPKGLRPKALEGVKEHFKKVLKKRGEIRRNLVANVVFGVT